LYPNVPTLYTGDIRIVCSTYGIRKLAKGVILGRGWITIFSFNLTILAKTLSLETLLQTTLNIIIVFHEDTNV
jgi:hypothetical protein